MAERQWQSGTFELGDFALTGGDTLRDARLAYLTRGRLNADRSNLVVLPTHYGGTMASNRPWADDAASPLTGDDYCLVVPALFGNGESTSPSNAHPSQAQRRFPAVSLLDNLRAQQRLIAEVFDDAPIRLVAGWSMGGMQALQWACAAPRRVKTALAICATARCYPHNGVFLEGVKAALTADPRYDDPDSPVGRKAFARVYAGWAYSQRFFRDGRYEELGFDSIDALLRFWENDHLAQNGNDLLAMLYTWQHADVGHTPGFDGDTRAALAAIRAAVIVMPSATDLYFTAEDAAADAAAIPGAECRVLDSDFGHCAGGPGREPQSMATIFAAMRSLLAR